MSTLEEGISAVRAGDNTKARKLLAEAIKAEPNNERAWMWMFNAVTTDKERKYCLDQVLRINPNNQKAIEFLKQLSNPTETKRETQTLNPTTLPKIEVNSSINSPTNPKNNNVLIGSITLLIILLICCCVLVLTLPKQERDYKQMAATQCRLYVKESLLSPSTAEFPFDQEAVDLKNNVYRVDSYVEAENVFGVKIRNSYTCKIQYIGDKDTEYSDPAYWKLLDLKSR